MQLQTTYPNNNYPIIVEHNAFEELSEYIQDYDKVFLIIDEYVDFNFKTKFMPLLESTHIYKIIVRWWEDEVVWTLSTNARAPSWIQFNT